MHVPLPPRPAPEPAAPIPGAAADSDALGLLSPPTRAWFTGAFEAPTAAQEGAWRTAAAGQDALVVAPTGSGKTLAAFLWSLDRIATTPAPENPLHRCRILYISPLKALAVDVERNLRAPLTGIRQAAQRLGTDLPDIQVAIRTGDTPADERRRFARKPPDVLITTPESLFLLLTAQSREALRGVETVIVDEVHAVAGTKRGAHLALSLERLDALLERPARRIGLSATVRPVEEVARFLGGTRDVVVVQPPSSKTVELEVVVPVADLSELGTSSARSAGPPPETRDVPRSGRTSRSASPTSSRPTGRRSSSPTPGASPSGSARASTRSTTNAPPGWTSTTPRSASRRPRRSWRRAARATGPRRCWPGPITAA